MMDVVLKMMDFTFKNDNFCRKQTFEIDRGEDRKSFPKRLERRVLLEFELYQTGLFKSTLLGKGHLGDLQALAGDSSMEASVVMP